MHILSIGVSQRRKNVNFYTVNVQRYELFAKNYISFFTTKLFVSFPFHVFITCAITKYCMLFIIYWFLCINVGVCCVCVRAIVFSSVSIDWVVIRMRRKKMNENGYSNHFNRLKTIAIYNPLFLLLLLFVILFLDKLDLHISFVFGYSW